MNEVKENITEPIEKPVRRLLTTQEKIALKKESLEKCHKQIITCQNKIKQLESEIASLEQSEIKMLMEQYNVPFDELVEYMKKLKQLKSGDEKL